MLLRILSKSLARRKGRIAIAVVSVVMGAAVATALMAISMDINEQVSSEFRKYGANLMVVPESDTIEVGFPGVDFGSVTEQGYINETDLWRIMTIDWRKNILGFAPFLYQVVTAEGPAGSQRVVLAGTFFNEDVKIDEPLVPSDPTVFTTGIRDINPWWRSEGSWIEDPTDSQGAMVGIKVAEKLGLAVGDRFSVTYSDGENGGTNVTSCNLTVIGIVSTDGNEDGQVFVNLHVAQSLSGRQDKVHTIQVSALCTNCPVDTFAREIEEKLPKAEARTVKQLVSAEMSILDKFEGMMAMVTIVALSASVLGVTTTMTTSVIERQKEIGLMKSVGAEQRRIVTLFLTEAAVIGVLGGVVGFVAGAVLAYMVGLSVFETAIATSLLLLPVALGISVGVALLSSVVPVRRAVAVDPIVVLRGE
jgi:putative ABC transport system permease protein